MTHRGRSRPDPPTRAAAGRIARERRRTRRFFNLVAPAFLLLDRYLLPDYHRLVGELALDPALTVLDLGTGTGTLARAFADRGHRVAGADFAERLLRRARRRLPEADLRLLDLIELPGAVPEDAFDLVSMAYLLHGLRPEMRRFLLAEARRIARRWVLVVDYHPRPGPWYVRSIERLEGPHYRSWTARPFTDLTAELGLPLERSGSLSRHGAWWLLRAHRGRP